MSNHESLSSIKTFILPPTPAIRDVARHSHCAQAYSHPPEQHSLHHCFSHFRQRQTPACRPDQQGVEVPRKDGVEAGRGGEGAGREGDGAYGGGEVVEEEEELLALGYLHIFVYDCPQIATCIIQIVYEYFQPLAGQDQARVHCSRLHQPPPQVQHLPGRLRRPPSHHLRPHFLLHLHRELGAREKKLPPLQKFAQDALPGEGPDRLQHDRRPPCPVPAPPVHLAGHLLPPQEAPALVPVPPAQVRQPPNRSLRRRGQQLRNPERRRSAVHRRQRPGALRLPGASPPSRLISFIATLHECSVGLRGGYGWDRDYMIERERLHRCGKHGAEVVAICRSPRCDHYRQLCGECVSEDSRHAGEQLGWREASEEALRVGRVALTGLQGVRARKNQEMEENMSNNPGLVELEAKLDEIEKLITQKLKAFRSNINRAYSNHVREKLDELDEVIERSEQLLQREVSRLEERDLGGLPLFFRHDFLHEVKYFESYFNEIFVKKIRSFKTAIENDRIFSLLTNFEQSLEKIFTIARPPPTQDRMRHFHLFANEDGQCYLYSLAQTQKELSAQPIAAMNRISHSKLALQEGAKYNWAGSPLSLYFPQNTCYYIIGEGARTSRLIVKYEHLRAADEAFTNVKSMESERRHFGVCLLGGEIYIIGGENDREGCLVKCEKFVPTHNNQVYLIHSLRHRSSRHSVTTYKDRYILKFGGTRRLLPEDPAEPLDPDWAAPPEIYSLKTEEWSVIPFYTRVAFNLCPSIFKAEHRNFILVLGGDPLGEQPGRYRPAFQVILEESKGEIDQVKMRARQSNIEFKDRIFNSTVALLDEDHECIFIKQKGDDGLQIGRYKIQL